MEEDLFVVFGVDDMTVQGVYGFGYLGRSSVFVSCLEYVLSVFVF